MDRIRPPAPALAPLGRLLVAFADYQDREGIPPSQRELAQAIGVSQPRISQQMARAEAEGMIERTGVLRQARVWTLTPAGRQAVRAMVGR